MTQSLSLSEHLLAQGKGTFAEHLLGPFICIFSITHPFPKHPSLPLRPTTFPLGLTVASWDTRGGEASSQVCTLLLSLSSCASGNRFLRLCCVCVEVRGQPSVSFLRHHLSNRFACRSLKRIQWARPAAQRALGIHLGDRVTFCSFMT